MKNYFNKSFNDSKNVDIGRQLEDTSKKLQLLL